MNLPKLVMNDVSIWLKEKARWLTSIYFCFEIKKRNETTETPRKQKTLEQKSLSRVLLEMQRPFQPRNGVFETKKKSTQPFSGLERERKLGNLFFRSLYFLEVLFPSVHTEKSTAREHFKRPQNFFISSIHSETIYFCRKKVASEKRHFWEILKWCFNFRMFITCVQSSLPKSQRIKRLT